MKLFLFTLLSLAVLCVSILIHKSRTIVQKRAVVASLSEKLILLERERPNLEAVLTGKKSRLRSENTEDVIRPQQLAKAREELTNKISELGEKAVDSSAYARIIPEILTVVADLNTAEFMKLLEELDARQSDDMVDTVVMVLASVAAESDPETILTSHFSSLRGADQFELRTSAFAAFLREDQGGAIRWLKEQSSLFERELDDFKGLVAMKLFSSDPEKALSYFRDSDLPRSKRDGRSFLPPNLSPAQSSQLADAISKEGDANHRKLLSESLIKQTVAKEGAIGLKTILDQLYSEDEWQLKAAALGASSEIYENVHSAEEANAFIKYASIFSKEQAETTLEIIVGAWARRDYGAAGEYLQTLPASSQRDAGITAFAKQISKVDPAAALDWAGGIQDSERAKETQKRIFDRWSENEKAEAEEWARENGTP